jgi:hypothetical protein
MQTTPFFATKRESKSTVEIDQRLKQTQTHKNVNQNETKSNVYNTW